MRSNSAADSNGRTPFGINLALGAVVMVGATMLAAAVFPPGGAWARLLVTAAAVGGYALTTADLAASLATAVLGYLLFTGFLVNRYGVLGWEGKISFWQLLVLSLPVGLAVVSRWVQGVKGEEARAADLNEILSTGGPRGDDVRRR